MQRVTQEEPWAKIPHWVVMCPDLDASAIRVYGVLSKHANRSRQSFPGLVKLAEEACMSKPTVIKALVQLEAVGAVEVKRERATNNRHKVNLYHLPLARGGSQNSLLGGGKGIELGSKESVPLSSKETEQELDLKNQVTRGLKIEEQKPEAIRPGESPVEAFKRLADLP